MKIHKFIQFYILFSVAQYICDFHLKNIFKTLFLKDTVIHTNHFFFFFWTSLVEIYLESSRTSNADETFAHETPAAFGSLYSDKVTATLLLIKSSLR